MIDEIKHRLGRSEEHTGVAFVVINSTLDTTLLLNKHSTTILNSYMNMLPECFSCWKRKKQPVISNANDGFEMKTAQVKLGGAPVPVDIIWENYSYSWVYRLLINIPVFFLQVTPLIFTVLATTYLLFLQSEANGSAGAKESADFLGTQM
jgi:hypothetical protein